MPSWSRVARGIEHRVRRIRPVGRRQNGIRRRAGETGSRSGATVIEIGSSDLRRHTCRSSAVDRPQLLQGEQERERRFGALVLIRTIDVQPVAAAAGRRIEEPVLQVVLAEKPVERAPRLRQPPRGRRCTRNASRHADTIAQASTGCWSNDRRRRTALIEPVGSDGRELFVGRRLQRDQPVERAQPGLDHVRSAHAITGDDERLRQPRVAVGHASPRTMASRAGWSAGTGRAADRRAR